MVDRQSLELPNGFFVSLALCFVAGSLYGSSAIIPALGNAYGVQLQKSGIVFSLAIVAFTVAVYFASRLPARYRGLTGAVWAGGFGALALVFSAFSPNYLAFLGFYSLGFGAASGAIYILCVELAGQSSHPKFLTPVMIAAFGLGGAVFGPAIRLLVGAGLGLRAIVFLAASLGLMTLLGWHRNKRGDPYERRHSEISSDRPALSTGVRSQRSATLLLWMTFVFGSAAGLMILGLASVMVESRGGTIALSSVALAGVAVGNTLGRLSVGGLAELIPPSVVIVLATLLVAIGVAVAGMAISPEQIAIGLVLVATGYGAMAAGIPTYTRLLFGTAAFGRKFSLIFTAWGVAGLTAPWFASYSYDATGDFKSAFSVAFGVTVLALLSSVWLWHSTRRHQSPVVTDNSDKNAEQGLKSSGNL